MNERRRRPWPTYLLALVVIGAIVAAYLVVGPPSESTATVTRTATAQRGVVQTTVSGSGDVEPVKQLDLGFKTSGVVSRIFVAQGQHVNEGQLLAELDPESAEVTLEQSRATLKTAEATLQQEEETGGESSAGNSSANRASAASVDYATVQQEPPAAGSAPGGNVTTSTTTSATTSIGTTSGAPSTSNRTPRTSAGKSPSRPHTETQATYSATSTTPSGSGSTLSSAAKAANIASASAAVKSDRLAVQSDEEALANTKLYAPSSGTLVSLSGEVGETVSGTGTTKAASSSSSSSESSSSSASALSALGRSSSSTTGSKESSSSNSSFAVLSDLSAMQLVVPLSESEIGEVKVGQPATVAVEALEGRKMAAEVTAISMLPTSNSGVVSYDVTFELIQLTEGLRPGMSATAEVVVKQAEGVNVPSNAITADTVTVLQSGKQARKSVTTGLVGNSSTIVISGLNAGEVVVLPAAKSTSSSASSLLSSRLGSRLSGGGLGGGLGAGAALRSGGAFPLPGGG